MCLTGDHTVKSYIYGPKGPFFFGAVMFDILIRDALIIDGTGAPGKRGDIGVSGDAIIAVGALAGSSAELFIDAGECVASPGFIDAHSHEDLSILVNPDSSAKLMQGVTTVVTGMDGLSLAPIDSRNIPLWKSYLAGINGFPEWEWTWRSFGEYLDTVDTTRPSVNLASYAGIGAIRLAVMGLDDRIATSDEIERMAYIARECMEEGAIGVSAGLIYPPNQYQTTEEIARIAAAARPFGGVFNVHLRSEGDRLFEAMEEAFMIGRKAGIPVVITHFKVMGRRNHGSAERALEMVDRARRDGVEVNLEQYPYTAASTTLQSVIPPWYLAGGTDDLMRSLCDHRDEVKRDIRERNDWENWSHAVGWENIVVSSSPSGRNAGAVGKSVAEIAANRGIADAADAAIDILMDERGAVSMIMHCMDENDVAAVMRHPETAVITDGILGGTPHPRAFGSFPRVLGRYVRETHTLQLEEAIRRMTSLSANRLNLSRKGRIAPGYDADIVLFDPNTIIDRGTYDSPEKPPEGIRWVVVRGEVAVRDGRHMGSSSGRVIRR